MHVPQTEIILRHGGVELARASLSPGEYVIGRNSDADVHADTPLISRKHALLTINFDQLFIEDLGSSNGTFVAGQPIKGATRLFPNQTIHLGDVLVEVRRQRAPTEPGVSLAPAQQTIRRLLPDELLAGKRYAIGKIVAQGGMGAILDAQQEAIKRRVAMKVMLDYAGEAEVLRFIEEAQITGQLEHPNIIPVHELGVDEQEQVFYTMKFVRGVTLKKALDLIAQGVPETVKKYPLSALLTIFQKVCDALAFAHSKGVIHRDLKPENIMLDDFGVVLVMDWGLAKVIGKKDTPGGEVIRSVVMSARSGEPDSAGSTQAGTIMGTPQYMSPEQARGEVETLDARSDIYALGTILFHILYLRPPISGIGADEIVEKVGRGAVEWLPESSTSSAKKSPQALPHLPGGRVPDSLGAVCRQTLAFDPAARYTSVGRLQADLLAYQNGFATSAEKASWLKRASLAVKRNKLASAAAALILLLVAGFTAKVMAEGRRAEREAERANAALLDLKKTAPALRQLAQSEADLQRFDSALEKLDAALTLDPHHLPAYWQRAWVLLGQEKFAEAGAALRIALEKDPAQRQYAAALPLIDELAAASEAERWKGDRGARLLNQLKMVGASGEVVALSRKLQLGAEEKLKLVRERVQKNFGGEISKIVSIDNAGSIMVYISNRAISTLETFRGLPLNRLVASDNNISGLDPLRGMQLYLLNLYSNKITDLSPLKGMPLRMLQIGANPVSDLSPLKGAPLEEFNCSNTPIHELSALQDAPLQKVDFAHCEVADLAFLARAPLEELQANLNLVHDLTPLRGKPLRKLFIAHNNVSDLSPLRGAPIDELDVSNNPVRDVSPLLELPKLEKLRVNNIGAALLPLRRHPSLKFIGLESGGHRPVAEFWAEYDAKQAEAQKKAGGT